MKDDLIDPMYREDILELYKNPMNYGELANNTNSAKKFNSSCGDEIEVFLIVKDNIIKDVKFKGNGCAISIATSSILTEKIKSKDINYVNNLKSEDVIKLLGIKVNTGRIKCATICLEAIKSALMKK